jgi:hypothetical protein
LAHLLLLRNTPSLTSVPSSRRSTWALETFTEPVRTLYCARAATPRSKVLRGAVDGFAGSSGSGGQRHDAELLQALALPVRQGLPDLGLPLLGQPLADVHADREPGQDLRRALLLDSREQVLATLESSGIGSASVLTVGTAAYMVLTRERRERRLRLDEVSLPSSVPPPGHVRRTPPRAADGTARRFIRRHPDPAPGRGCRAAVQAPSS